MELTAGPDVCKLAQAKVGDRVAVEYLEALSLTLKKDGKVEAHCVQALGMSVEPPPAAKK